MNDVEVVKFVKNLKDVDWFGNLILSGGRLLTKEEEVSLGMSLTMIFVGKVNNRIVNNGSDSEYHIVAGHGYFHRGVDGQIETIPVEPGSVVRIPKGTPYWDVPRVGEGLFMVSINHPPYDPKMIKTLNKI
ncbi:hypothetical protein KBD75_00185 [Candidatus Woesebacteria bacterium]|nr:hypothetical protein [Candidatus Woesebacteria bacterium]